MLVSQSSKTVFIAPTFDPVKMTVDSKDDRIVLVKRKKHHIDLARFMNDINPESVFQKTVEAKNTLRSQSGLSRKKARLKTSK